MSPAIQRSQVDRATYTEAREALPSSWATSLAACLKWTVNVSKMRMRWASTTSGNRIALRIVTLRLQLLLPKPSRGTSYRSALRRRVRAGPSSSPTTSTMGISQMNCTVAPSRCDTRPSADFALRPAATWMCGARQSFSGSQASVPPPSASSVSTCTSSHTGASGSASGSHEPTSRAARRPPTNVGMYPARMSWSAQNCVRPSKKSSPWSRASTNCLPVRTWAKRMVGVLCAGRWWSGAVEERLRDLRARRVGCQQGGQEQPGLVRGEGSCPEQATGQQVALGAVEAVSRGQDGAGTDASGEDDRHGGRQLLQRAAPALGDVTDAERGHHEAGDLVL